MMIFQPQNRSQIVIYFMWFFQVEQKRCYIEPCFVILTDYINIKC